jgi:hypothetical protein
MPEAKKNDPSVLKAFVFGVVIFGLIAFAVMALNTQDILWFWPVFNETPVQIEVNCYGKNMHVNPGTNAFTTLNAAVNSSLTGVKRWDETTMSQTTYQDYQTSSSVLVLRLHYDPPATVHSQYAFMKSVNWLVIPLVGRHADTYAVFGLEGAYIDPGSYHINSTTQIVNALQQQGICTKQ